MPHEKTLPEMVSALIRLHGSFVELAKKRRVTQFEFVEECDRIVNGGSLTRLVESDFPDRPFRKIEKVEMWATEVAFLSWAGRLTERVSDE